MAGTAIIAAICVIALVTGLIRLIQYRHEVAIAETQQKMLTQQYDFNPGNIISDGQLLNGNTMSASEVQSFLLEQGAGCQGNQCLHSITFDTENQSGEGLCADYAGQAHESAAQIIDKSARACSISQKVLLTMLQKEQHLVSATNPSDFQYKAAMGLSCPDDADCDPAYAGFAKQVYGAAQRFQYYRAHESQYNFHAKALNFVQYNPQTSCGGSNVYIENQATALLYIYTPYQPNVSALKAGVGEGDSCSSYGNRNFSIIYQGWFGNPRD